MVGGRVALRQDGAVLAVKILLAGDAADFRVEHRPRGLTGKGLPLPIGHAPAPVRCAVFDLVLDGSDLAEDVRAPRLLIGRVDRNVGLVRVY